MVYLRPGPASNRGHHEAEGRDGNLAKQIPFLLAFKASFLIEFDDDPTIVILAHLEHMLLDIVLELQENLTLRVQ